MYILNKKEIKPNLCVVNAKRCGAFPNRSHNISKKCLLLEIDTKFLLFKMNDVTDGGCLFDN